MLPFAHRIVFRSLHRSRRRLALCAVGLALGGAPGMAQVFVVGEKSATADLPVDFSPSHVTLSDAGLNERGARELQRNLVGEQGFAHRALPMAAGLTLEANGALKPGVEAYKKLIYEKGQAAAPGDRVAITALKIEPDRMLIDLNGGPYLKHRFLRHISVNGVSTVQNDGDRATGTRITLTFEGGVPDISAPEVKLLLEPLIDFGVKSGGQAYAETLPGPVKESIAAHEVLVGMNHRMVLAALGPPESKMREHAEGDLNGPRFEEWIYGHAPQTVKFVRFDGDRVALVKIAAVGKPIEIHDRNELGDFLPPPPTHEIALGDRPLGDPDHPASAPTLKRVGDPETPGANNNAVQFPRVSKPAGGESTP